jgi:DNA-binding NarL/FixJ family response regulator
MTENPEPEPTPQLTSREFEVACRLAVGVTNRKIADELGIAVKTVDSHRMNLMHKLKIENNVKLAHLAIRNGWVELL